MKYQMRCPKCGYEFAYDNGYYDRNIARLGAEIREINQKLTEYKLLSWGEKKEKEEWRKRAITRLTAAQKEIGELKAIRKVCDQQVRAVRFQILKCLVKERLGDAEYTEIMQRVDKEAEAYKISGLMRHEYTRSNAKANVTSINKL